jgi:hypothetical protein
MVDEATHEKLASCRGESIPKEPWSRRLKKSGV